MMSRPGNGAPPSIVSGIARAAASDTPPRIPDHPRTSGIRQVGYGSRSLILLNRKRGTYASGKTNASRIRITAAQTPAAESASSLVDHPSSSSSTRGICSPTRAKSAALRMNVRIVQKASPWSRVSAFVSSGVYQPM